MLGEQAALRQEELGNFDELGSLSESEDGRQRDSSIIEKMFEESSHHGHDTFYSELVHAHLEQCG